MSYDQLLKVFWESTIRRRGCARATTSARSTAPRSTRRRAQRDAAEARAPCPRAARREPATARSPPRSPRPATSTTPRTTTSSTSQEPERVLRPGRYRRVLPGRCGQADEGARLVRRRDGGSRYSRPPPPGFRDLCSRSTDRAGGVTAALDDPSRGGECRRRRRRGHGPPSEAARCRREWATSPCIGVPSRSTMASRGRVVRVGADVGHVQHRADRRLRRLERGDHARPACAAHHAAMIASSASRCAIRPANVAKRGSSPTPRRRSTRAATVSADVDTPTHFPSAHRYVPRGTVYGRPGAEPRLLLPRHLVQRDQRSHDLEHALQQVDVDHLADSGVQRDHRGEGRRRDRSPRRSVRSAGAAAGRRGRR